MTEALDQWREQFRADAGIADEFPATVEATETPAEPEADTVAEETSSTDEATHHSKEQARGDDGKFAAKEPAVEDAEGEEVAAEEGDPDVAKYLEKYNGNVDEALKAAVEAQRVIGRQGAEVGELRKVADEVAELRQMLTERQEAPAQQTQQYDIDAVSAALAENPTLIPQVAFKALEMNDRALYAKAMEQWVEIDPAGAMDYSSRVAAHDAVTALREELSPVMANTLKAEQTEAQAAAVEAVTAKRPDFAQVIDTVDKTILDSVHPSVLEAIRTGDTASKTQALETLYLAAKGHQAETLPKAVEAAARTTREQADQERRDAVVGSASSQSPATREGTNRVDAWREQFRDTPEYRKAAGLT